MPSMGSFLHRLRFQVVGIGVIQHQPRNLVHVQVGKGAHVVAAEGRSYQDIRPANAGMVKRSMQLLGDVHAGTGHGPGSLNPAPARS